VQMNIMVISTNTKVYVQTFNVEPTQISFSGMVEEEERAAENLLASSTVKVTVPPVGFLGYPLSVSTSKQGGFSVASFSLSMYLSELTRGGKERC